MGQLLIIIASTRPGRVGLPVGRWFESVAQEHGGFEVAVADLAEIDLPFVDEPNHPRLRQYQHEHTKRWSATVEAADAIAFVMPEYNYGLNAPLKNAIDFLNQEWSHKPLGLVSYGGVSAGTRAAQMVKQVVSSVGLMPMMTAVSIPFVARMINDSGELEPNEVMEKASVALLDEMVAAEAALRPLRQS